MKVFIAIDIGGTFIKYGFVDEEGRVLSDGKTATQAERGGRLLQNSVVGIIGRLAGERPDISGIGISTAGIVDVQRGRVVYANDNMPGYTGTEWKKPLEDRFQKPVIVNNDVNAAALAEAWVGTARNIRDFFCMTIGTGIGGAAFVDGKLFTGAHYHSAEIGYMVTEGPGVRFEKLASTSALIRLSERRTGSGRLDGKVIFQKAKEGDAVYRDILADWIIRLSSGIANVIYMFDPSLIVIGGGISGEGPYLIDRIREGLENAVPDKPLLENVEIRPAACGNSAGMIGSVYGFTHSQPGG